METWQTGLSPQAGGQSPADSLAGVDRRYWIAGGLFVASLALYISTLAPSVVTLFDDSLEFQLVTYQLGIAHPTGYPLYTLLGKLFTFLPVGNIAYRVNLMSAFSGAAAVALVYLVTLQVAAKPTLPTFQPASPSSWPLHLGAVGGALLLAVSPIFWQQATVAEVYTLNAFFVALLLWLAITFPRNSTGGKVRLLGLAFTAGLALTHHRTILLLWPALALYLYLAQKPALFSRESFKTAVLAVGLGLLPLLLYLYLPWRGHIGSLDGTYQNTWAGFWRQVTAEGYGTFLLDNPLSQARDLAFYWGLLESQFYVTMPGFIGVLYLARVGQPKMLLLTGTAFLTYTAFNLFYQVGDIEVFFIPVFMIWAIWSGAGAAFLFGVAARLKYHRWRPWGLGLLAAVFLVILFQLFQAGRAELSRRNTWQVHDYGLDILAQSIPAGQSAIVGILGEVTLVRYFQQTPGLSPDRQRTDVVTIAADAETDRRAVVDRLLQAEKSVYLTRELPGAPQRWSLNAVGPLIRVDPQPVRTLPPVSYTVEQAITPQINLRGYSLSRPPHTGPGPAPLRLTLFWQPISRITTDLKVSARLLGPAGEPLAAVDASPVHFAYPTTAWRPGEIISDVYDLALPPAMPAGPYRLLLIWYDPAQNAVEVGRLELAPIAVE